MLSRLLQSLPPYMVKHKLLAISDLVALEFFATNTMASYMAKVHGLANSLHGVSINSFVALLALSCLDPDLYPNIWLHSSKLIPPSYPSISMVSRLTWRRKVDLRNYSPQQTKSTALQPPNPHLRLLPLQLTMTTNILPKVQSATTRLKLPTKLDTLSVAGGQPTQYALKMGVLELLLLVLFFLAMPPKQRNL